MSLFQTSVVKKYLNDLSPELIDKKYNEFQTYFGNTERQENIRNLKEEEFQSEFIRNLFVNILEYTLNPEPNFNIVLEKKNVDDSKKADGAIIKDKEVVAVIELKSTQTTDLKTVESQAFGYKNHNPKCQYIITSNFEKIRFYIQNTTEYLEYDLFNLSKEQFSEMWLCLSKDNVLHDIPLKIKESSVLQEENITQKLYNDYSKFRNDIFENIVKNNPEFDKLVLFKKTQKLLDRFLFIFFAEDRLLVPPNSITQIIEKWKDDVDFGDEKPLYSIFKQYFHVLNVGRPKSGKRQEIYAYNGGLFLPDNILDNLIIDNEVLHENTLKLSSYNFETEVDVNILGHIFEHSLTEIENVQAEITGKEVDVLKTKRKKDGIFYTPKYITKFIVENTVGKLCKEKREQIGIIEEISFERKKDGKLSKKAKDYFELLEEYRSWLQNITILDPACGSGAFLNQALEFLINEHGFITSQIQNITGDVSTIFIDVEKEILEKNLYGVDLNDESVEIAKLSLWLRTAQKGRKLTTLSNHIKCGNSLIDNPEIAGEKAFNWQNEFPDVFAKGGFDVIIGNPPYVRQELFKDIKPYLEKHYECYNSIADLYTYFIEKGIELMNTKGTFSFILPNKFLKAAYGYEIRKFIKKSVQIDLIFDFDDYPIFDDATTYPIIFIFSKEILKNKEAFDFSGINKRINTTDPIGSLRSKIIKVSYDSLKDDNWQIQDIKNEKLLNKIKTGSTFLKEVVNNKIFRGVTTGKNEVFIIDKQTAEKLLNENNKKYIRKIVTGKEVKRYNLNFDDLYLLYIPWEYDIEFDNGIKEYLLKHKEILSDRPEVKEGRFNWWCLSRYGSKNAEFLFEPKIIYPRINNECNFYFDEKGTFSLSDNNFFISTNENYLIPILNSKVVFYYLQSIASTLQGGYLDFRRPYIEIIPIKIPNLKTPFIEKSELMHSLNNQLQDTLQKFQRTLSRKFDLMDLPRKLNDWSSLTYSEFIKELNKKKIKLTLSEEAEWEEYFMQESKKSLELKLQISKINTEINQMVYELYGLTEEEIKIIEEI